MIRRFAAREVTAREVFVSVLERKASRFVELSDFDCAIDSVDWIHSPRFCASTYPSSVLENHLLFSRL
jgi:hypothetical protein